MSFGKLVGSIDEGTTSARFMIFRAGTNNVVCYHQIAVPSIYPQEGWVEQDPIIIYDLVVECMEEAVKKLEKLGGSIKVNI
ncbi:probable glycerol kinase [Rhagoletis pomonella]|uniref:probable glycerol kinase n=1 Tax=Rhagoletis pomonella TaxID=28610 RepID=UPI0017807019|nr:probable glycerol kinase [Rhagoletis pomonella]